MLTGLPRASERDCCVHEKEDTKLIVTTLRCDLATIVAVDKQ